MSDKFKGWLVIGGVVVLFIAATAGRQNAGKQGSGRGGLTFECTNCQGTGQADCIHCNHGTVTNAFGPNYSCAVCGGDGKLWCPHCAGRGRKYSNPFDVQKLVRGGVDRNAERSTVSDPANVSRSSVI